ncbi:AAA family ATPase [uncultured Jatrophihabitans sp.]|uniref:AAA family ATPase n=1 Tax=uncultured Jatrophihabitans sp. TaxID=1610747 RepID=UPI0035CB5957
MKIVRLQAENIKRLVAVEITPDGNTVVIAGKNGQGKTSVLDSIWFALGGGPAARGTTKPIRDGQDHAEVRLDLGELRVTRTWNASGKSTLRVDNAEGASYRSPQSMLDNLVGRLSFDPLAFAQQDDRTQLASLLELVDLPFDPVKLAGQRQDLYDERTTIGRAGKQLEGQLASMAQPADDVPKDEVNVADLLARHRAGRAAADEHQQLVRRQQSFAAAVDRDQQDVAHLEQQLAAARATLTDHIGELEHATRAVEQDHNLPDVEAIEKQLSEADEVNRAVRAARERADVAAHLAETRAAYDALSGQIADLDRRKTAAIAAAAMPIEGLAFDDTGVTYRDVPFKQCSAAEQLRVSLAMAMAMNPQIRVVRITDGSLLDSDNMQLIEQMAAEQDYQVWIERVDESGQVGVVIEDGQVAS